MKKLSILLLLLPVICYGQQNLPAGINFSFSKGTEPEAQKINKKFVRVNEEDGYVDYKLPVFSIFGVANMNQDALKNFNAGGKASIAVRPWMKPKHDSQKNIINALAIYASFNKSASNNDSIVHSKLIFPELGSNAFTGTLQWERYSISKGGKLYSHSVFVEMAVKSIKADSGVKKQSLTFDALNYTFGYRYGFDYILDNPFEKGKKLNLGFYFSPFLSAYNIPDEDRSDYKKIMLANATLTGNGDDLSDFVVNFGAKTGFHINGLDFFADMRHVFGDSKVPVRELKGFHINVGFVFNADVLNFY